MQMNYYNINNREELVGFEEAVVKGQAADGGLYFPSHIPQWDKEFIDSLPQLSRLEIAAAILKPYIGDFMSGKELDELLKVVLSFDFPLKQINEKIYALELFHGPTLAFKDLGARFLSRLLQHLDKKQLPKKKRVVLVATSGDTGGAVADAFFNMEHTTVIILYPSGKVSPIQEKQLTTYGGNIHALEVQGDFDDCQRLVKKAFRDPALQQHYNLTSSNSINIARWLSQQIYYAVALAQWKEEQPPVIAVPSGNFGNLCAGLIAAASGLPSKHFIAACNKNSVFTDYINTGNYQPQAAIPTISNAMDVGNPSNAIRIFELYHNNYSSLKKQISSYSISDERTKYTISEVHAHSNYILDPHTAVAYAALDQHLSVNQDQKGFILATAHPFKFLKTVENAIGSSIELPNELQNLLNGEKKSTHLKPDYESFVNKLYLLCKQNTSFC
jgi:threonine synthase